MKQMASIGMLKNKTTADEFYKYCADVDLAEAKPKVEKINIRKILRKIMKCTIFIKNCALNSPIGLEKILIHESPNK